MERVTIRDLGDAQLVVRRQYRLTLNRDGSGHAGLAQLLTIKVEAPRRLAIMAQRMEAREQGTRVQFLLDANGRIISMGNAADPDDSRLRGDLAAVAQRFKQDPFPAALARMNTDRVAGWPDFLFAPQSQLAASAEGLWQLDTHDADVRRITTARIDAQSGLVTQLDLTLESGPESDRRLDRDRFTLTRQDAAQPAK